MIKHGWLAVVIIKINALQCLLSITRYQTTGLCYSESLIQINGYEQCFFLSLCRSRQWRLENITINNLKPTTMRWSEWDWKTNLVYSKTTNLVSSFLFRCNLTFTHCWILPAGNYTCHRALQFLVILSSSMEDCGRSREATDGPEQVHI